MALHIDQPLILPAPGTSRTAQPLTVTPPVNQAPMNQADARLTGSDYMGISDQNPAPEDEFTFLDFLDIINPLQHIPVVSTIYRSITGDEIGAPARILGDTLFGGPIGLALGVINVALEENTGKDVGDHVLAFFDPEGAEPAGNVAVAEAPAPPSQSAFAAATPQLAGTAFPQVAQQPAYAQQVNQAPVPPVTRGQANGPRGPLFSTDKGFSPYMPLSPRQSPQAEQVAALPATPKPTYQPAPGRLYGNTNIPMQMSGKPAPTLTNTVSQTPPPVPAAPSPLAKDSQAFRQVSTFKPDPKTVLRALEAQGFDTQQTSHPMLNLGPSANPGPGAGVAGKSWGLNPTRTLAPGTQAGGVPMIDPALKAKMAEYHINQSKQNKSNTQR